MNAGFLALVHFAAAAWAIGMMAFTIMLWRRLLAMTVELDQLMALGRPALRPPPARRGMPTAPGAMFDDAEGRN